jgi:hypothetical protein
LGKYDGLSGALWWVGEGDWEREEAPANEVEVEP